MSMSRLLLMIFNSLSKSELIFDKHQSPDFNAFLSGVSGPLSIEIAQCGMAVFVFRELNLLNMTTSSRS